MANENFSNSLYYKYRHFRAQLYNVSAKKPQSIANLLSKSTFQQLLRRTNAIERLNSLLKQVVSSPLKEHCQAVGVAAGKLLIQTDSPVWASRLRYQQQGILALLKKNDELSFLTGLSIQVRPEAGKKNPTKRKAAAPSADSAAQMDRLAEEIHDPKLKEALRKIARRASKKT